MDGHLHIVINVQQLKKKDLKNYMGNLFPEKKKQRKERTKEQPDYLKTGLCWYDDDTKFKECGRPWSYLCDGNIHKCAHLKQKWYASLSDKNKAQRFKIKALIKPISICFGFHFMKSFFHYGGKDGDNKIELYTNLLKLFEYMKKESITAKVMMPQVGSFILMPRVVRIDDLINIVSEYCQAGKPKEMRFYHLAQDRLLDILEENTHA